jgi:hypothetical protein
MERKPVKSKRGAWKRRDAIIRQCYRDAAGGTQYGIDMPTLRVTWPDRYAELKALQAAFESLPE